MSSAKQRAGRQNPPDMQQVTRRIGFRPLLSSAPPTPSHLKSNTANQLGSDERYEVICKETPHCIFLTCSLVMVDGRVRFS